jgi:superfamily II DNA or RNA helicase
MRMVLCREDESVTERSQRRGRRIRSAEHRQYAEEVFSTLGAAGHAVRGT